MKKLKTSAFDNMVGVPNDIQSDILRVELETAGITSLLQEPYGEPKATISGILVFESGQTMVLHRAWYYWSAWLIMPLSLKAALALHDKWGKFVRRDGNAGSPRPTTSVDNYHIDTQDGLNAFVTAVKAEFGEALTETHSNTFRDGMALVNKQAATPLAAYSELERNVTNISTLLELALWHNSDDVRQAILYKALAKAENLFPGNDKWLTRVRNELAMFYRERVRKAKEQLARPTRDQEGYMFTVMGIERDQRARAKMLVAVGYAKNAQSCLNDAVALRPQIIKALIKHRDSLLDMLKGMKEDEHDYYWHRVAFMEFMLGRFNRMLGKHEESRRHFTECRRIRSLLSTEHYKRQLISWIGMWH